MTCRQVKMHEELTWHYGKDYEYDVPGLSQQSTHNTRRPCELRKACSYLVQRSPFQIRSCHTSQAAELVRIKRHMLTLPLQGGLCTHRHKRVVELPIVSAAGDGHKRKPFILRAVLPQQRSLVLRINQGGLDELKVLSERQPLLRVVVVKLIAVVFRARVRPRSTYRPCIPTTRVIFDAIVLSVLRVVFEGIPGRRHRGRAHTRSTGGRPPPLSVVSTLREHALSRTLRNSRNDF